MESHGGMILTGENRRTPSATLYTTNPTWTDPVSNLGLRGERPANDYLSLPLTPRYDLITVRGNTNFSKFSLKIVDILLLDIMLIIN
jgi:hypothetical protein